MKCKIKINGGMTKYEIKPAVLLDGVMLEVRAELDRANSIHPAMFNSSNEAAGVVREEYLELERELFHGDPERAREEAIQVAAVAIKTVIYLDKKLGRNAK